LRVIFQMPSYSDYLTPAFDEIPQYGAGSIQVIRRMRSALAELAESVESDRAAVVNAYIDHLDWSIDAPISVLKIAWRRGSKIDRDWGSLSDTKD
jgi:hypothetical protein